MADRAAFIVGVARSGTSLFVSLLDDHPELSVLPYESKVLDWCGAADPVSELLGNSRYGTLFPEGTSERDLLESEMRAHIRGPTDMRTALLGLVAGVRRARPPRPTESMWVEKTPKHLRSVPLIARAFGADTRFVCMLRDPRAVLSSQHKRWGRAGTVSVRAFCRRWATADALTRQFEQELPHFRVFRYEDLVAAPEQTMRAAAEHLGIAWNDSLLAPSRRGEDWAANSSFGRTVKGLTTDAVERWREELEPREVRVLERLLGARMERRGYAPDGPGGLYWRRAYMEGASLWSLWRERRRWRKAESASQEG